MGDGTHVVADDGGNVDEVDGRQCEASLLPEEVPVLLLWVSKSAPPIDRRHHASSF